MKHSYILRTLMSSAIALGLASPLMALSISKNAGPTTPVLGDFSPAFANHANKTGYGNTTPDRMFLETFRLECTQGQKVTAASFSIQVTKLTQGANRGDNDALAFWAAGVSTPLFNTYLWKPSHSAGTTYTHTFNLAALPSGMLPASGSTIINTTPNILANLSRLSFSVQDDTSVRAAKLDYTCSGDVGGGVKKGMTWAAYSPSVHQNKVSGTAVVGCQGQHPNDCNAYQGDQICTVALPVLCAKPLGLNDPAADNHPGTYNSNGRHWYGGIIGTTPAMPGNSFNNIAAVNAYCAQQFGNGWVAAEHHMAGGWSARAYGNVGDTSKRFWVDISDQPNATCWTR